MAGETIQLFNDTHSATDRARIERVLGLVASVIGYIPENISVTPGVKPPAWTEGSPYGWYLRSIGGEFYLQMVIWNADDETWDHFGPAMVSSTILDSQITALQSEISEAQYVQSDPENISGASRVTNIVYMTQQDYDSLESYDASTQYIIVPEEA